MDGSRAAKNNESGSKELSDSVRNLRRASRNRESTDELAQLEAELRRAYVSKELKAQLAEREANRYVENLQKERAAETIRLREQLALENEHQLKSRNSKRSEEYRKYLETQITRKQREETLNKEEERKERQLLEELDRITEEKHRLKVLEKKCVLAETAKKERQILQEMKEIRRQREVEEEERELLKDLEYSVKIQRRAKEVEELRREHREKRDRLVQEVANMIVDTEVKRHEKEKLVAELAAEEIRCELLVREEEERQRKKRMREELAAGLVEQIIFTERCKRRFVELDIEFAEEIKSKVAEDERMARLTTDAKRRARLRHREDLERLIRERRRIREEEMARMEEIAREERRTEEIRKDTVREERRKLLSEHASKVADFLDRKVLLGEEREIVEEALRKREESGSTISGNSEMARRKLEVPFEAD